MLETEKLEIISELLMHFERNLYPSQAPVNKDAKFFRCSACLHSLP